MTVRLTKTDEKQSGAECERLPFIECRFFFQLMFHVVFLTYD